MINQELLNSLNATDKVALMRSLEELISQSYQIENEFIELKGLFEGVLELLPNALWVLDEKGDLVYQNDESLKINNLLPLICDFQGSGEVELGRVLPHQGEQKNGQEHSLCHRHHRRKAQGAADFDGANLGESRA